MSLLTIIQRVAQRVNIASPSTAIGNTNREIIQLLAIANEEGDELFSRGRWQALISESTFASVATESQGAMTSLAGTDFSWLCADTMLNRTRNLPIMPVDDVDWQHMKSSTVTGPHEKFRIRGGNLIVIPTMTAGHTVAFEWVSKNWCQSSAGAGQSAWVADTDTGKLDERLMTKGVLWRWKKFKGLDYAQDFEEYEAMVADALARDGAKMRLNFGGQRGGRFLSNSSISQGNWSL